jgi:hypothetical protein
MPRNGRPRLVNGPNRNLRRLAPESLIVNYRVADLPDIFSLYLDAVEIALRNSAASAGEPADDGQRRATVGKPAAWHVV